MSAHLHLLPHPEWTGFRESLRGLDGRILWLTVEGQRKGPYRMVILSAGMGPPTCRRHAIELVSGLPDEPNSWYLDPHISDRITEVKSGRAKMLELNLDALESPTSV